MSQSPLEVSSRDSYEPPVNVNEQELNETYKPFKVFINNVDSYLPKYATAFISDQIYGRSKIIQSGGGEEALGEAEEPPIKSVIPENAPKDKYEFIGSLTARYRKSSEDILQVVNEEDEEFKDQILKCGFIIYDITSDPSEITKALKTLSLLTEQLDEVKEIGPKTYESFTEVKTFILISTVMTWALTKPLDPDDPELPFSEVDYRKRRPHPNYKKHFNCEKEVIKIGKKYKDKLKTYILCTGLVYGEEEDVLEFFFKMAWYNEVLPIFDTGNNKVPFIHVRDLAKALHGLMENRPSKPQYILAVEQTPTTLKQFIKRLSKALGDSKTTNIVAEEAFLYNNMTQKIFEMCTVNLNMEPVFLLENLQLEWQSDMNIAENINQIVNEFKNRRKLKPVKIIIHGPPASGKTMLAQKLCNYYGSKYISISTMLNDYIKIWKESMIKPEKPKVEETEMLGEEELEEEVEEEEEDPQQILEQIRELQMFMEGGIEKIPHDYIAGLLKSYLTQNFCQNRGYVLDDYPQSIEQARELFGQSENLGAEEEEAQVADPSIIIPGLVVSLVATDEFITNRLMQLPEEELKDTPYEEDTILERLEIFRENNTDDNTVLNYFDELEVDILLLEVKDDEHEENFAIVGNQLGPPPIFGLTPEEEEELRRIEEEEKRLAAEKDELNKQMEIEKAEDERKAKMEAWSETLEKLQMEEEKILVAQSEPLRHYLMKYVFPTLTKGLIELAALKPDDPVDFLAEYLFKENPEGKMFNPMYTAEGEDIYGEFKGYIDNIIEKHEAFNE